MTLSVSARFQRDRVMSCLRLEELALLDLLCKLGRGTNRFQLVLRPEFNRLRFDRECASTAREKLAFKTLCELARFRDALVIDEPAPSHIASDAEVILRASEEGTSVVARFWRGSVMVWRTTHHRDRLQEQQEARTVRDASRKTCL